MAKCDVCGRWAGIFSSRHSTCIVDRIVVDLFKPLTNYDMHEPLESPAMSFGFGKQFTRKWSDQGLALLRKRVGRVLHYRKLEDPAVIDAVVAQLVHLSDSGGGARDLRKWCRGSEAPPAVYGLEKCWIGLLEWCMISVWATTDAIERYFDFYEDVFPYMQCTSFACRLASHAAFDGFIARSNDPIWKTLIPPFGWACNCTVLSLHGNDQSVTPEANKPALDRLDPKLIASCVRWEYRKPTEVLKILDW